MCDTPALLFDASAITAARQQAEPRGQVWRCEGVDPRVFGEPVPLALVSPYEATAVPKCDDLLITRSLIDVTPWRQVLSERNVRLTVEHFVHLELLQCAVAREKSLRPLQVVIEVAVGPARFGCRPGRDTVDLARVIESTPYIEFAGLSAEVCSPGMADSLLQTREQLLDAGLSCDFVTVRCTSDLAGALPSGLEVRHDGGIGVGTVASVIGRPTLEHAVLDVGAEIGLAVRDDISIQQANHAKAVVARVRQLDSGRALLSVPTEGADLTIGTRVVVNRLPLTRLEAHPVGSDSV